MGKYIKNKRLNIKRSDSSDLHHKLKDARENLDDILSYIYHQISLDHNKMINIYKHLDVPITFDDSNDSPNNDYYRSKLTFENYKEEDDIYYYNIDDDLDICYYENKSMIIELHNFLTEFSPKKLRIGNYTTMLLKNEQGINKDARGVRYLDWRLYFWKEYEIEKESNITFHDLIIAAHKIRSHKFENNYELYCGIESWGGTDNFLMATIKFDHGS